MVESLQPPYTIALANQTFGMIPPVFQRLLPEGKLVSCKPDDLREALALIPLMAPAGPELLDQAPRLRLVQQWGAGLEGVDVAAATQRGVAVANVPTGATGNAASVAEWCVMAAIVLSRRLDEARALVREGGVWGAPMGRALTGKRAGILGLGGIGEALAIRLRPFGLRLEGVRRQPDPKQTARLGLEWVGTLDQLDEMLERLDYLFLCLPASAETRGVIGTRQLACLPAGAILINGARGPLVDRDALWQALDSGHLGGAALDVYWQEPVSPADPFVGHPRVLATPHVAGATDASYAGIGAAVAENVRRAAAGRVPLYCINPEVVGAW